MEEAELSLVASGLGESAGRPSLLFVDAQGAFEAADDSGRGVLVPGAAILAPIQFERVEPFAEVMKFRLGLELVTINLHRRNFLFFRGRTRRRINVVAFFAAGYRIRGVIEQATADRRRSRGQGRGRRRLLDSSLVLRQHRLYRGEIFRPPIARVVFVGARLPQRTRQRLRGAAAFFPLQIRAHFLPFLTHFRCHFTEQRRQQPQRNYRRSGAYFQGRTTLGRVAVMEIVLVHVSLDRAYRVASHERVTPETPTINRSYRHWRPVQFLVRQLQIHELYRRRKIWIFLGVLDDRRVQNVPGTFHVHSGPVHAQQMDSSQISQSPK